MRFSRQCGVLMLVFLSAAAVLLGGCCGVPARNNLPPAQMLMEPGPGVGGPGPGISVYQPAMPVVPQVSQVAFVGPEGMTVGWDVAVPGQFDSEPLIVPGRYNFPQGAIFRLKLANIAGRAGIELYPTLEVAPATPRTEAFLAHNAIPAQFTEEDFDQVLSGNFVTKVIYLPDPEYQELALAGVETLVSTRLDPGVDPIVEADRRGSILAIVRLGNKDLQVPGPGPGQEGTAMGDSGVTQASYNQIAGCGCPGGPIPMGMAVASPTTMPSGYISGVTTPQYGMPMCGTPIGLPGPPHVPLGIPAGLQRHKIVNHTAMSIPGPTHDVRVDVKQSPGFSYPKPANRVCIVERTTQGPGVNCQPCDGQVVTPGCATGACPIPSDCEVPAYGADPGYGVEDYGTGAGVSTVGSDN